jgi:hypothetical protein
VRKLLCFAGIFIVPFLLFSCSDDGVSPDQKEYILPAKNLSYYDDLLPMLEGKCGFECHSNNVNIITIPFQNKDAFIDYRLSFTGEVLVDTVLHKIDPTRSPLYRVVAVFDYLGDNDIMPPLAAGRSPLTENQINGIKQWIAEGAPD